MDKAQFLKNDLVTLISGIPADHQPAWGKMNLQQMTEHIAREGFGWASGKIVHTRVLTPDEHLPQVRAFLVSEKQFRENTENKLMPAEPIPVQHADMPAALEALQQEIDHFFAVYAADPGKTLLNPFFGELDYDLWIQLLHKHASHHLKQFGVTA
ncbi:DinB family protein [Taibaiella koreensis]|uniref:DinB family protein n=1 Tax=Taibaiella koreensis TaxID=1268548 RepID=UPI000E59EE24|nr:DinB family protein [Taibaiella koreensis]